jgi:hypothetical protein
MYLLSTWCGFAIDQTSKLGLMRDRARNGQCPGPGARRIVAYALLVMNTVALYNIPKNPMAWHLAGCLDLDSF